MPANLAAASWDRLMWGVIHQIETPWGDTPMLLGDAWKLNAAERLSRYKEGEPPHALLFPTRKAAREWCRKETEAAKRHSDGWTFRPVRVRETVEPLAR